MASRNGSDSMSPTVPPTSTSTTSLSGATRRTAQQRLKQLEGDLQKADAAIQGEKYMEADRILKGISERIQAVVETLTKATTSQSQRRRG